MIADAEAIRALAGEMSQLAGRTRSVAAELRSADGVDFESEAAERYRRELRDEADGVERAAREIDDAARSLLEHAGSVDGALAALASAARGLKNLAEDILP